MNIYFGEDYNYLYMTYFGSPQYSAKDNHIGINISAKTIDGIKTLENYMAEYIVYMLEPYDGRQYTLLDSNQAELHGRVFRQCVFEVVLEGWRIYHMLTMTREVNDGYYLTLSGSYWPENKNALENIRQFMNKGPDFL